MKKFTNFEIVNSWILFHKTKSNILNIWFFESFEIDGFDKKFRVEF